MAKTIDPADAASVTEAVRGIEASSSAEVVVEVRSQSGSYAHADARSGALVAFAALLFILFSPWTFDPTWVPGTVLSAYAMGMLVSRLSDGARRVLTGRRDRDQRVRTQAAAAFVERGVANTEGETGLLVYLSLLERRIELIADRGLLDAVPVLEWNQLLESARTREATMSTLVEVIHALQPLLARYSPSRESDRDELSNEVRFVDK
jgi:putative membrane protein